MSESSAVLQKTGARERRPLWTLSIADSTGLQPVLAPIGLLHMPVCNAVSGRRFQAVMGARAEQMTDCPGGAAASKGHGS